MAAQPSLISFIVPAYNAADTLEVCIGYIRSQALVDDSKSRLEIVVVDNGSSDGTEEIGKQLADLCKVAPEASISELRNIGARASTGEVLVFVDSDCLLEPNWLSLALEHLEVEQVAMVGSKTHKLPDDSTWVADAWKLHLDRSGEDLNPHWIVTRALAVKREAFFEVGGFDETKDTCEDVALGHAIAKNYKIVSDNRLSPIHLKDASTLKELFKKEQWRGLDSIKTSFQFIFAGRLNLKEMLSLALPFYFSFFAILLVLGVILQLGCWVLIGSLAIFLPIIFMSLNTAFRVNKIEKTPQLVAVYATYISARSLALFRPVVSWIK